MWSSDGFNVGITCDKLKNAHKFENLCHTELVISLCLDLVSMIYEGSMTNLAFMCKIWSFYDQACGQEDCPQTWQQWAIHDCMGSLAFMPNEPKIMTSLHVDKS